MTNLKAEFLQDVDIKTLSVGDTVDCSHGVYRKLGESGRVTYTVRADDDELPGLDYSPEPSE